MVFKYRLSRNWGLQEYQKLQYVFLKNFTVVCHHVRVCLLYELKIGIDNTMLEVTLFLNLLYVII